MSAGSPPKETGLPAKETPMANDSTTRLLGGSPLGVIGRLIMVSDYLFHASSYAMQAK